MPSLTPDVALFVGGFVAALFFFAAALTYVAGGGVALLDGLSLALVGIGVLFLAVGALIAGAMAVSNRD